MRFPLESTAPQRVVVFQQALIAHAHQARDAFRHAQDAGGNTSLNDCCAWCHCWLYNDNKAIAA
jgi:hypothetical protein